jgi:hypothetical protein
MAEPQLRQAAQTELVMEMQAERVALLLERNQAAAAAEPARLVEMEAQQQVDQVALEQMRFQLGLLQFLLECP